MAIANVLSDTNAASLSWNVRDELKSLTLEQINIQQPKFPYAVAMLNTTGSLNIGVAMRSSVIFGATDFFIVGNRHYDRRSTVGAQNYINTERLKHYDENGVLNDRALVLDLENRGYTPVVIEQGYPTIDSFNHNPIKNPCFIFGEEQLGVPDALAEQCEGYSIEQFGVLRSLNVSVSVGIVLYEISKTFAKSD